MILWLTLSDRADDYDQSWTLDGLGNFAEFDDDGTSQTRDTNEANEIESISGGWITPVYDAVGNMIFGPKSGDETTGLHFVRDAWNRQVAVYTDDGDGVFEPSTDDTLIGEYEFDAINRRIEKILSSTHAHYYYNQNWQMLEERFVDGQGATLSSNQHVFSVRYIDSPIVWLHDGNGDGDLEDVGDLVRYYLSDANHNTTAVFDEATGLVVNRYVYTPYGDHTVYDANWSNPSAPTSDGITYCGYWRDAETGNYQVRNREYITCLSTFDVRDPIGYDAGDANLYRYVDNNPAIYVDPSGNDFYILAKSRKNIPWHRKVCVDTWNQDQTCKTGIICFSFFSDNLLKGKVIPDGNSWLGFTVAYKGGLASTGTIDIDNTAGKKVSTKTSTMQEDRWWYLYMLTKRRGVKDHYTTGLKPPYNNGLNCRLYSQLEFDAAPDGV